MDTIGEFASMGRVTVRMLRHYDAIGLLRPAEVDPLTGYRRYRREQLRDLGRIVGLRRLGFSLEEIRAASEDRSVGALLAMHRRRRAALALEAALVAERIRVVDDRIRRLEQGTMSERIELKPVAAVRLAEATADVAQMDQSSIGPIIGPMFGRLVGALRAGGTTPVGPPVAYYEALEDGVRVHAGFPVPQGAESAGDWTVAELPAVGLAATATHHGAMATIDASWAELGVAITERSDLRPTGVPREVYLVSMPVDDQSRWVTELQWPVERVPAD